MSTEIVNDLSRTVLESIFTSLIGSGDGDRLEIGLRLAADFDTGIGEGKRGRLVFFSPLVGFESLGEGAVETVSDETPLRFSSATFFAARGERVDIAKYAGGVRC